MSVVQNLFGALLVPPFLLLLLGIAGGLLAWRGYHAGGLAAALACVAVLLLATPLVSGMLLYSLEREIAFIGGTSPPQAIIILGGDATQGTLGPEVGQLTLERLRAGAALHRRTGLPILVTGGILSLGRPPLAVTMAASLQNDFNVTVRWVEPGAADTRQNALRSAELLRKDGIDSALLVTQSWHLPRAQASFARAGFEVQPAPVRLSRRSALQPRDLLPRADYLVESWYYLREWTGRIFYDLRDGRPPEQVSWQSHDLAGPGRGRWA